MSLFKFKLNFLLKVFAIFSILIIATAITTENWCLKLIAFINVSIFTLILSDWNFLAAELFDSKPEQCFRSKIKKYLKWTIFFEISFLLWLCMMTCIQEETDFSDEASSILAALIWFLLYHQIKKMPKIAERYSWYIEQKKIHDARMQSICKSRIMLIGY